MISHRAQLFLLSILLGLSGGEISFVVAAGAGAAGAELISDANGSDHDFVIPAQGTNPEKDSLPQTERPSLLRQVGTTTKPPAVPETPETMSSPPVVDDAGTPKQPLRLNLLRAEDPEHLEQRPAVHTSNSVPPEEQARHVTVEADATVTANNAPTANKAPTVTVEADEETLSASSEEDQAVLKEIELRRQSARDRVLYGESSKAMKKMKRMHKFCAPHFEVWKRIHPEMGQKIDDKAAIVAQDIREQKKKDPSFSDPTMVKAFAQNMNIYSETEAEKSVKVHDNLGLRVLEL